MHLHEYINESALHERIRDGFVEVRSHPTLPLNLYCHSRRCTLETVWDEVTTKTRGLIVNYNTDEIVARPFEKFFNINTSWRPETMVANLPYEQPVVTEKLDGSLGILYRYGQNVGIATKGSFTSEQALWATEFYNKHHKNSRWPDGYTPVFEIICEDVQHHVVHYGAGGYQGLHLLALVHNRTGEELNPFSLRMWGHRMNGIPCAMQHDTKTVTNCLEEDRPNTEGYVLSWFRMGQAPLKVKVKHPGFLSLQKVVHAATPRAILEHLKTGNTSLLDTWIGQTNDVVGKWVQEWVAKFNGKYGDILFHCHWARAVKANSRKEFAKHILSHTNPLVVPNVCFAMEDGKDHTKAIWKAVEQHFEKELGQPFALGEDD